MSHHLLSNEFQDFEDPAHGAPLESVMPLSLRATCLVARSKNAAVLKNHLIHVLGAIEMLDGLDYHAENFVRTLQESGDEALSSDSRADHEAIAYLNRMGQFCAFAGSEFVRSELESSDQLIPTFKKFINFRHKISAHRAIDSPRRDSPEQQLIYAGSMSPLGGRLYTPKHHVQPPSFPQPPTISALLSHAKTVRQSCYLEYQVHDAVSGEALNFSLEREHPIMALEAYEVVAALLERKEEGTPSQ